MNPSDCFSIVFRGHVCHSWWLYSYDVLPAAGYVWVCQREMPRRVLSRALWHIHVRPVGLIRAHSPRSVNPLNPSYPSKSVFKKKLDAIMVCPISSRSLVKMWGDNIWYVLIKWYDSYEHRITSWHILNCVPHFAKRDPFFARRLFLFVKFWRDFTFKKKIWVISVSILLPSEEKDVSLTGQKAKGWISARESIP